jgi:alpha-mannosidase
VFRFRFAVTSGDRLSRIDLARFDADVRAPVVAYPFVSTFSAAVAKAGRPLPAAGGSFLGLDDPNLQMVVLKEAEDGDGYILRVREVAGRAGEAQLRLPTMRLKEAWLCNGVEVNQKKLAHSVSSVTVPYQPNRYVTVRLQGEGKL